MAPHHHHHQLYCPHFAAGVMKFPPAMSNNHDVAAEAAEHALPASAVNQILDLSGVVESAEGIKDDAQTVGDGAVDIRGRPSVKSRSGNWKASALIFGQCICS